ncbi:MAG: polyprenyl synthetase family protein, partial [Bacteroidota bacterium]
DITEEVYYEIIRKKTAVLLAACASIGAGATGVSEEIAEHMWKFGEQVGMAFQIKDDIFDLQTNGATGKPSGNDLKEKKMTLPLIYALQNAEPSEKRRIIKIVKSKNKTAANINEVVEFITKKEGMEYAGKKMNEFKDCAIKMLDRFPDNPAKKSLISLVHYTTTRDK